MDNNTYRFFVDAGSFAGRRVRVRDRELAHQLRGVLRLAPGALVTMLDGMGQAYSVRLEAIERDEVRGSVEAQVQATGEAQTSLTLCPALFKSDRFEWLLQKGTELGATRFIPLVSARSLPGDLGESKLARWQRIIREAAEQSRRGLIPSLEQPQRLEAICQRFGAQALLLWEGAGGQPLGAALAQQAADLALISGPEGGFTQQEVAQAQQHHVALVTLGPRTLRAETAPLVAASAILFQRGDLD